jgi:hypothetical protein
MEIGKKIINFYIFSLLNVLLIRDGIENNINGSRTVSVVLSKRSPSRYHVITAGGREPALWHNRSYLRPADSG